MNLGPLIGASILPQSLMEAHWFAVLSAFVAINTIVYVSLSIFKILPKLYLSDVVRTHGRRAETRSIHPDGHGPPGDPAPPVDGGAVRAVTPP